MSGRLTAISFGLALLTAIFLLFGPVYWGSNGDHRTLVQMNGRWVVFPVMFPVLLALAPLVIRKQRVRVIAGLVMAGFVAFTGFSIGSVYAPACFVLLMAATCSAAPRSDPGATP